ncbi:MAG: DUF488 domain-containing protein [candidate division WOR-3 bacterium]
MKTLWPHRGTIYSVGHSNRKIDEFIAILVKNGVELVADVRRFPGSRKHPWFCRENLEAFLKEHGIRYIWLGESLGGFRKGGYEKYAKTEEFEKGLKDLENLAEEHRVAFMCAEAFEGKCHRKHIARELEARGWEVIRIG